MEQKAERIERTSAVSYLGTEVTQDVTTTSINTVRHGLRMSVTRWTEPEMRSDGMVTLTLSGSAFSLSTELHAYEARLIAQALLMAADDADKALQAAQAEEAAA